MYNTQALIILSLWMRMQHSFLLSLQVNWHGMFFLIFLICLLYLDLKIGFTDLGHGFLPILGIFVFIS